MSTIEIPEPVVTIDVDYHYGKSRYDEDTKVRGTISVFGAEVWVGQWFAVDYDLYDYEEAAEAARDDAKARVRLVLDKLFNDHPEDETMTERKISDAEAIERIVTMYRQSGQEWIFDEVSSTIEYIGDTLELTGRQTWFETPQED